MVEGQTRQCNNFTKNEQSRAGLVLTSSSITETRKEDFHKHWSALLIRSAETPAEFLQSSFFGDIDILPAETVAGDLAAFLDIVAKQNDGRAGGEDGVVT